MKSDSTLNSSSMNKAAAPDVSTDVFADWELEEEESALTLVGAVGALLVAVVAAVVVAVAGPVLGDAAAAVALELHAGTGVTAPGFIAVVSTVIICTQAWTQSPISNVIKIRSLFIINQCLAMSCAGFSSLCTTLPLVVDTPYFPLTCMFLMLKRPISIRAC